MFNNSQVFDDVGRKKARGGYAYAQMEFNSGDMGRWHLGLLWDSAPDLENPSAETTSLSPYLTWWPSEFNRIRLQYTHGDDEVGEVSWHEGRQVYLQWTTVSAAIRMASASDAEASDMCEGPCGAASGFRLRKARSSV